MALIVPPQVQSAASRLYARQGAAIRRGLEDALDDEWDDIDWEDDDDDDGELAEVFAARAAPLSRAAQRGLVARLGGYLAVVARIPFRGFDEDEVLEDDPGAWRTPAFSMWAALGAGVAFAEAIAQARRDVERKADTELAIAQTRAMAALTEGTGVRYHRVLAGEGCDFCVELAGVEVASGDAMEIHPGCNCSVEPVL